MGLGEFVLYNVLAFMLVCLGLWQLNNNQSRFGRAVGWFMIIANSSIILSYLYMSFLHGVPSG